MSLLEEISQLPSLSPISYTSWKQFSFGRNTSSAFPPPLAPQVQRGSPALCFPCGLYKGIAISINLPSIHIFHGLSILADHLLNSSLFCLLFHEHIVGFLTEQTEILTAPQESERTSWKSACPYATEISGDGSMNVPFCSRCETANLYHTSK